jgi:hypothetical protein
MHTAYQLGLIFRRYLLPFYTTLTSVQARLLSEVSAKDEAVRESREAADVLTTSLAQVQHTRTTQCMDWPTIPGQTSGNTEVVPPVT